MTVLESIVTANYCPFTSLMAHLLQLWLTVITIPPYQQPNNGGSCFLTVLCPRGWLSSFHGGCFKVHSNPLDWNSAKSACEALGSSLAVLNSKAKLRDFPQLLKSAAASKRVLWIGLYRNPENKQGWLWVGRSTVYFTSWDTGEPNNYESNDEDCGELRMPSGKWNDLPCHYHRPYICEISGKYNILHEHIYMQTIDGLKLVLSPRINSTNVYTGRLLPNFSRKRYPFRIPSIDKWYLFHIPCLELCIPFNCRKCTVF